MANGLIIPNGNAILAYTDSMSVALANAKSFIVMVGKGTFNNNPVALSLFIPISALEATSRYFEVSDAYNSGADLHLQVNVSKTQASNIALLNGASHITDEAFEYYYI